MQTNLSKPNCFILILAYLKSVICVKTNQKHSDLTMYQNKKKNLRCIMMEILIKISKLIRKVMHLRSIINSFSCFHTFADILFKKLFDCCHWLMLHHEGDTELPLWVKSTFFTAGKSCICFLQDLRLYLSPLVYDPIQLKRNIARHDIESLEKSWIFQGLTTFTNGLCLTRHFRLYFVTFSQIFPRAKCLFEIGQK